MAKGGAVCASTRRRAPPRRQIHDALQSGGTRGILRGALMSGARRLLPVAALLAGTTLLLGAVTPAVAADKLARRLDRALAGLEAGDARASDPMVQQVRKLLPDLERDVLLQRKAFAAMAAKGLPTEAAGQVEEARRAYEESHGG